MLDAEIHVPLARAGILVDVAMEVEGGDHVVLAHWNMAQHEIMLAEHAPHGDLVEVIHQVSLDDIMIAKDQALATMKLVKDTAGCGITHGNVPEMINSITLLDGFVPASQHAVVHLLDIVKWSDLVASIVCEVKEVGMTEMGIADEPYVLNWFGDYGYTHCHSPISCSMHRIIASCFPLT